MVDFVKSSCLKRRGLVVIGASLLVFLFALEVFAFDIVSVTISEQKIFVNPGIVKLSDIAEIDCGNKSLKSRVGNIKLFEISYGETKRLKLEDIVNIIEASGVGGFRLKLSGPSEVEITTVVQRDLGLNFIAKVIKDASGFKGNIRLKTKVYYADIIKVGRIITPNYIVPGTPYVSINFLMPDGTTKTIPFEVEWFDSVVVADKLIPRSKIVQASDIKLVKMRIKQGMSYFSSMEDVVGKMAKNAIARGQVISPDDLTERYLVRRLQIVRIVARVSAVEVYAKGQALDNGKKGDIIRVKNLSSKRIINARVIGEGLVEAIGED